MLDNLTSAIFPCLERGRLNLNLTELDDVVYEYGELRRPMPAALMRDRIITVVKGEEGHEPPDCGASALL
jgi:hypothetical protein